MLRRCPCRLRPAILVSAVDNGPTGGSELVSKLVSGPPVIIALTGKPADKLWDSATLALPSSMTSPTSSVPGRKLAANDSAPLCIRVKAVGFQQSSNRNGPAP